MNEKIDALNRVRNTVSTRRRAINMKLAVEHFRKGPVDGNQLSIVLAYSISGTRKYINDMIACDILIPEQLPNRTSIYHLTQNKELLAYFITSLDEILAVEILSEDSLLKNKKRRDPSLAGRHIHFAIDDVSFRVSTAPNIGEGQRDPLVSFLFGPPKSQPKDSYAPADDPA